MSKDKDNNAKISHFVLSWIIRLNFKTTKLYINFIEEGLLKLIHQVKEIKIIKCNTYDHVQLSM